MLQFVSAPTANAAITQPTTPSLLILSLIIAILLIGVVVVVVLRILLREKNKRTKAFDRIVLQIQVPKERKSEGQGGQAGTEDRLEQIKEEVAITETFFSSIAALRAQRGVSRWFTGRDDDIAFEIVVHNHLIYFYVDAPVKFQRFLEQQIHAQYPYAQIEEMTDYNIFTKESTIIGAYLHAKNAAVLPFKSYKKMESDPLSAVLNTLATVYEGNSSAAIQFIVRSAHRKWRRRGVRIVRDIKKGEKPERVINRSAFGRFMGSFARSAFDSTQTNKKNELGAQHHDHKLSAMEEEMLKGIEEKLSKGGMDVTTRVLSVSDNEHTARMNLDNILNAFGQYNLYQYGNTLAAAIPRNQKKLVRDFIFRSFDEKRSMLFNTEEMASFWHLPLHSTEAPNIKWLQGRKSAPPANLPTEGLLLGYVDYRGVKQDVHLKEADRRRHLYIIGKSGSGKSVTIANLAIQDIKDGKGVAVVDPHGDLVEDILAHIPKERADDVIIFNPSDMERPIGLNMLEARSAEQADFAVQEMISIFYKLFPPEMIGPMFEHNMRNVMLTLMANRESPGTVIDIPRMFTDDEFVKKYKKHLTDPVVQAYWDKEMAKTSDFHKSEMLGYLISKLGRFVGNEMMRNIMGQQKSGFDFRDVMDKQKILLVNLAKGTTGEVNAKLLGLIVVAKLQMAAMGRADMDEKERKDFYLYIDEFQNFVTDSISTILSEARKYRLDLIIGHQFMGQLVDDKGRAEIRDAVLGNVGTIMVGRIGPDDSEILAKEFAPTFGSYDLLNTPQYSFYVKELIDNTASKPFLMHAYPPMEGNKELANAIKQLARLKYGRDKRIVEAEILDRTQLAEAAAASEGMAEASL